MRRLSDISELDRSRPVSVLALGPKTVRLQQGGFTRLGDVLDDAAGDFEGLRRLPALGQRSIGQVRERVGALLSAAGPEGRIDWDMFGRLCGLEPDAHEPDPTPFAAADRAVSITRLHLGVRSDRLIAGGLMTVGCLEDDRSDGFRRLSQAPRLGDAAIMLVRRRLRSLDSCRNADGGIDWGAFDALCSGQALELATPSLTSTLPAPGSAMPADAHLARSVVALGLGAKTERLEQGGLRTVGDVLRDAAQDFRDVRRLPAFGRRSIQLMAERVGAVLTCTDAVGEVDWNAFERLCGLLPAAGDGPAVALTDEDRAVPVEKLHLGSRAARLVEAGMTTVGALEDDRAAGFQKLRAAAFVGAAALTLVERRLRTIGLCRSGEGAVDWVRFDTVCRGGVVEAPPSLSPVARAEPVLSAGARARPVEVLRLGPKAKFLRHAGLSTLGRLLRDGVLPRLAGLQGLGATTADLIRVRLADLEASADDAGEPRWDEVAAAWGYPVSPDHPLPSGDAFLASAPQVISDWIEAHESEADRLILRERLVRSRDGRLKLKDLGRRLGLTRERVRQREKRLLDGLCDALLADDQSRSPIQFSTDFRGWWIRGRSAFDDTGSLDWAGFVSGLERAWGVPAPRLTDLLPLALAILTDGGQVMPPRIVIPHRLLEPLSPTLLRMPLRALPLGRALDDLEAAGCTAFGGLLLAAMENRLPQGRSGSAGAEMLSAVARSIDADGKLAPERLAQALDLPMSPRTAPVSAEAFLAGFDEAVAETLERGRQTGRARDVWMTRTRHPARVRPTLEETAAIVGGHAPTMKREETVLLASLNAQLVEKDMTQAGVIWRREFLSRVDEAAAVRDGVAGDHDRFIEGLSDRWGIDPSRLRRETAGLWAVLSLYPHGRRRPSPVRASPPPPPEEPPHAPEVIILRGFRRAH